VRPATGGGTSRLRAPDSVGRVPLPVVTATAYLTALKEGGSLPGIVEADDLGTYVVKFRAAGQGPKALVAEIVVGALGRTLGLRVPALAVIEVDAEIGRREPDPEIQDLLVRSAGRNLAVDYLPGSLGFDVGSAAARSRVDPVEAATVLWLDALTANVDRTWRNPNLLMWHRQLWCIDHGAALRFHHAWGRTQSFAASAFDWSQHVLRDLAAPLAPLAEGLAVQVSAAALDSALEQVPGDWLAPDPLRPDPGAPADPAAARAAYRDVLLARLEAMPSWLPANQAGGGAA
jgi:hypothetical protein